MKVINAEIINAGGICDASEALASLDHVSRAQPPKQMYSKTKHAVAGTLLRERLPWNHFTIIPDVQARRM